MKTLNSQEIEYVNCGSLKDTLAITGMLSVSSSFFLISYYFKNSIFFIPTFLLGGIFATSTLMWYMLESNTNTNTNRVINFHRKTASP